MVAINKVYNKVIELLNNNENLGGVNAEQVAASLGLKRSVVSLYLNKLYEQGKLNKKGSHPVLFFIESINSSDILDEIIGADGSLHDIIELCRSSVIYPPSGLPLLIEGNSGTGKSFLAQKIYRYAIEKSIINCNAPFITLNCADYANNPELLSSILFGYIRGAFTGAEQEKKGILEEANGGYLFLDEVHRLSPENQEKLFLFIDQGIFRRLGEQSGWHKANVRFLFATSECSNEVLLDTFHRRISLIVKLPDYKNRSYKERIELIFSLYNKEVARLKRNIYLPYSAVKYLLNLQSKGNIGSLNNIVHVSCARAYTDQYNEKDTIKVFMKYLDDEYIDEADDLGITFYYGENIAPKAKMFLPENQVFEKVIGTIKEHNMNNNGLFKSISSILNNTEVNFELGEYNQYLKMSIINRLKKICELYCVKNDVRLQNGILLILNLSKFQVEKEVVILIKEKWDELKRINENACYIANKLIDSLTDYDFSSKELATFLLGVFLLDYVRNSTKIKALIVCHGKNTASSITDVVNTLLNDFLFEGIDMPLYCNPESIVKKVIEYIDQFDTKYGFLLMVDMGSLEQLYEPIKNHLYGELAIINNVSTGIALSIGEKLQQNYDFDSLTKHIIDESKIQLKYYEGISKESNIVISCISGMGVAQKISKIFKKYIKSDYEIIVMDYKSMKDLLKEENIHKLKNTKLIITTNECKCNYIPCITVLEILNKQCEYLLKQILKEDNTGSTLENVRGEIVSLFSAEGIATALSFLDCKKVISDIDNVLACYEEYYKKKLPSHLRMNLNLHIAMMIERLMINKGEVNEDIIVPTEFYELSKKAFYIIESKYHIEVSSYEILLIYEVLKCEIE